MPEVIHEWKDMLCDDQTTDAWHMIGSMAKLASDREVVSHEFPMPEF